MKVIHIVHGKANPASANGISRVVYYLNKYEKLAGIDSQIWAIVDGQKEHSSYTRDEFVTVECFPRVTLWGGRDIIERLEREKDSIDIVHFHLIWFYDKNIIIKAVQRLGIRSVVTTHGTYSKPHAYTGVRRVARSLYELDYLNSADECHILTREEGTGLRKYGYTGRSFVAYNGYEPSDMPIGERINRDFFKDYPFHDRTIITMISVLRSDKNIDFIIRAISMLPEKQREKFAFVLIGPDNKGNAARFNALAKELGVSDNFYWIGPLYKDDKYNAMLSSDGYIMASDSEGFSMSVIDAMACGMPMILTSGCNMKYLSNTPFYLMCEPYAQDLARAIEYFLSNPDEMKTFGKNAQELCEKELHWNRIVETMIENYERIVKTHQKQ
jgi:glycosyltransferase involved in cell wall biosynthesis